MNISEIARRANVSTATVSRTINQSGAVKSDTARKVWRAIDELKYYPNSHARTLVSGRSRLLGLIVSDITNPFFPELVRSFGRELTGIWLDEAHPQMIENPESRERFRYMVEAGRPTWRKGAPLWTRHPDHRSLETCIVPLAADGAIVDKLLGFCVMFDSQGRAI